MTFSSEYQINQKMSMKDARLAVEKAFERRGCSLAEDTNLKEDEGKPKMSFFGRLKRKKEHLNTSKSSSSDEEKPKMSIFGRHK